MKATMKKPLLVAAAFLVLGFGRGAGATPLSVDESVRMALATHEDIQAAEAARDAARWDLSSTRRATGFNFAWRSEATHIGGSDYGYYQSRYRHRDATPEDDYWNWLINMFYGRQNDPYQSAYTNSLSLRFPVYTGGRQENSIEADRQALNAADLALENARQEVRFRALQAYYDLLQRINLRNISKSAVGMAGSQCALIRVHFQEGAVAYADLLQMEVQLADYRQSLISAEGRLEAARYTLARVVGLQQDTPIEPTDDLTYVPFPKTLPECEEYALTHRPDGAAAECRVRQYEANKNAQKADWQPTIQAIANKNVVSNQPFAKDRTETWGVGLQLSWSVFDNGVTAAKVHAAKEQELEARAEADNLRSNILLETRNAYAEMKAAEKNIRDTRRAVRQAEESLKIAQTRYDEGVDILLSVTKAQEKLNTARSNYYTALYRYNLNRVTLEKAIGVPVAIDVPLYMAAVEQGKSANEAMKEAALSPAAGVTPVRETRG